jgi:hypothetical protein
LDHQNSGLPRLPSAKIFWRFFNPLEALFLCMLITLAHQDAVFQLFPTNQKQQILSLATTAPTRGETGRSQTCGSRPVPFIFFNPSSASPRLRFRIHSPTRSV